MTLLSMWLAITCIAAAALVELAVAWDLATPLGLREHTITVYDTPPAQPDGRVMRITDWRGVQHECDLGSSKPRPSAAAQDLDGAWDLLDRDANATCSKLDLGWFTLELCYGERVRQFHEKDGTLDEEYVLGLFEAGGRTDSDRVRASDAPTAGSAAARKTPYLQDRYSAGDTCSVTGRPRHADVRYLCKPQAAGLAIAAFAETAKCEYLVTVHSAALCEHPRFASKPHQVQVRCGPVAGAADPEPAAEEQGECPAEAAA